MFVIQPTSQHSVQENQNGIFWLSPGKNARISSYCTTFWRTAEQSLARTSPSVPFLAPGARSIWQRETHSPWHAPGPWFQSIGDGPPAACASWRTERLPTWCTCSPFPESLAVSASAYRAFPSHVATFSHCTQVIFIRWHPFVKQSCEKCCEKRWITLKSGKYYGFLLPHYYFPFFRWSKYL